MKLFLDQEAGVNRNSGLHALFQGRSLFFLMLSYPFFFFPTKGNGYFFMHPRGDFCTIMHHSGNVCLQAKIMAH